MFETATVSSPGGRADNQDALGHRTVNGSGCWTVADGLGGHRGGEMASRLAADAILASFEENSAITPDALDTHLARANRAVVERQAAEPQLVHMRTTIVTLIASPETAIWAHAGDSRLYWFREGKIREQTLDDSVPQRLVAAGEIAADQIRFHEDRSRLLNSLGAREQATVTNRQMPEKLSTCDAFLLASDGFWESVTEPEMEADFGAAKDSKSWIGRMEARVRSRAATDHDNYSAIAVRVLGKN